MMGQIMNAKANSDQAALETQSTVSTNGSQWAGRVLSILPALFLLMDAGMKLFKLPAAVTATLQLGYPESAIVPIGVILLASTLLYLVPRTAILGAILLTGYLGGAVASKVRVQAGWFDLLFPVLLGALVWGGLWLRDSRLRELVPSRPALEK
jgi:DoxX-like protein